MSDKTDPERCAETFIYKLGLVVGPDGKAADVKRWPDTRSGSQMVSLQTRIWVSDGVGGLGQYLTMHCNPDGYGERQFQRVETELLGTCLAHESKSDTELTGSKGRSSRAGAPIAGVHVGIKTTGLRWGRFSMVESRNMCSGIDL